MSTAFTDLPSSVAEAHRHAFALLAAILLDTAKNRIQIEEEILQDEFLQLILSVYETVIVEGVAPPFECRFGLPVPLEQHCVEVMATERASRKRPFLLPNLIGIWTNPKDGLPWYQSSAVEFTPSLPTIRTSNIGGEPLLRIELREAQQKSESRHQRTNRRPRVAASERTSAGARELPGLGRPLDC